MPSVLGSVTLVAYFVRTYVRWPSGDTGAGEVNAAVGGAELVEQEASRAEAYQTLLARVGRRSPQVPAEVLVRHVLGCVPPQEWPVRVEAMDALLRRLESARKDGLRIGALKGFVDGSLGSHTAAMLEPFTDTPDDRGLFVNTPENLYRWTKGADAAGLHLIVHAIGEFAHGGRSNRLGRAGFQRAYARRHGRGCRRARHAAAIARRGARQRQHHQASSEA